MGDVPENTNISAATHPSLNTKLGSNAKIRLYPTVRYENYHLHRNNSNKRKFVKPKRDVPTKVLTSQLLTILDYQPLLRHSTNI